MREFKIIGETIRRCRQNTLQIILIRIITVTRGLIENWLSTFQSDRLNTYHTLWLHVLTLKMIQACYLLPRG